MNIDSVQSLLVIAAHPDDEVLGCGATLARAAADGVKTHVKFLGEGISARFDADQYQSDEFKYQSEVRKRSAINALGHLNVREYEFGERLCGQFDTYPFLSIVKDIEEAIQCVKPDLLLTHNESEVNIDHRLTYEAVEVATRPTREFVPKKIMSFEIPCSGMWNFSAVFKPNIFIDAEDFWDTKILAWSQYVDEAREYPFPRSNEGLTALAQYRGMQAGIKLAEAFRLERLVVC